jgi:hypothetical protein
MVRASAIAAVLESVGANVRRLRYRRGMTQEKKLAEADKMG